MYIFDDRHKFVEEDVAYLVFTVIGKILQFVVLQEERSRWYFAITLIQDDLVTAMVMTTTMAIVIPILIVHYYRQLFLVINLVQGFILLVVHFNR